jgi:hypothetical protein
MLRNKCRRSLADGARQDTGIKDPNRGGLSTLLASLDPSSTSKPKTRPLLFVASSIIEVNSIQTPFTQADIIAIMLASMYSRPRTPLGSRPSLGATWSLPGIIY